MLTEKRSAELLAKQNETDVKLAEAVSLNDAQVEELADLRAALEAWEEKWYNEGFTDAENFAEPVVNQARRLGFEAGWFAALQATGVSKDSPLRDPVRYHSRSQLQPNRTPQHPLTKKRRQA